MKFLYACDIHGDVKKYEKLFEIVKKENINYMVLGGDLLPKRGDRQAIQPEFIENELNNYFKKLSDNNIKCIFILGNDDLEQFDKKVDNLCNKYPNIYNIDKKRVDIEDISFIGLSNVLDHPFKIKNRVLLEKDLEMQPQCSESIYINECTEIITVDEWREYRKNNVNKMEDVLLNLPKMDKTKKTIYVFHDPPYGIGLDMCKSGVEVGSKAIKNFLENSDCYMSLHGHIHESPDISGVWHNELNKTICIQPGQTELNEEDLIYLIVDTDLNKQDRFKIPVI